MPADDSIPFGYCHCGCGGRTTIAPKTDRGRGHVLGQPIRFILYHQCSRNTRFQWLVAALANHSDNSCLLWPFGKDQRGYGSVCFRGSNVYTHRLSFYLTYGHWPTPEGCHECDTPGCFNPKHIFEGTHKDNCQDSARKLRHPQRKLTLDQVLKIRTEYVKGKHGHGYTALSKKFGVSMSAIRSIISRKAWNLDYVVTR